MTKVYKLTYGLSMKLPTNLAGILAMTANHQTLLLLLLLLKKDQ